MFNKQHGRHSATTNSHRGPFIQATNVPNYDRTQFPGQVSKRLCLTTSQESSKQPDDCCAELRARIERLENITRNIEFTTFLPNGSGVEFRGRITSSDWNGVDGSFGNA